MIKTITANRAGIKEYLKEVYASRAMIMVFAKRDIKTKYAQTFFGLFWVILQPLTGATIFTFFFTNLFDLKDFGIYIPYFLFSLSGYSAWMFFLYVVTNGGMSLQAEEGLIKKVNFPKLILPISKMLVALLDFGIATILTIILALLGGFLSFTNIWLIFIPISLMVILGLGIAIWLSALTIRYRDFHHFIPYVINFGIWITPVFYPATIIPEQYEFALYFNPMAGAIDLFRWTLFGTAMPSVYYLISYGASILLLVSGIRYFTKIENLIADHL